MKYEWTFCTIRAGVRLQDGVFVQNHFALYSRHYTYDQLLPSNYVPADPMWWGVVGPAGRRDRAMNNSPSRACLLHEAINSKLMWRPQLLWIDLSKFKAISISTACG